MPNCLHWPVLSRKNALFFSVLCRRGDFTSSALRCVFFIFYVIDMLLVCYDYLDGSDFLSLFFELFEALVVIMCVIC